MRNLFMLFRFYTMFLGGIVGLSMGLNAQSPKLHTPSCQELMQSDSTAFPLELTHYGLDSSRTHLPEYREASIHSDEAWEICFTSAWNNSRKGDLLYHITGKAIYRLEIRPDGSVGKMCYLKMPHRLVDEVFSDCIREMKFDPASSPDGNVSSWTSFPIRFGVDH